MRRLATFVTGRPKTVIAVWVVTVVACGSLAPKLSDAVENGGYDVPGSDSERVQRIERSAFAGSGTELFVGLSVDTPNRAALVGEARRVREVLAQRSEVAATDRPRFERGGRLALVRAAMDVDLGTAQKRLSDLRSALERGRSDDVEISLLGQPAVLDRYSDVAREDLARAERIALPITAAVLCVAFLSLIAANLPGLLAMMALGLTFGALYGVAQVMDLSVFVTNTALILGLGLSIDFSLFLVTRFREFLRDRDKVAAAQAAVETTGRAIVLSGITVAVSLAGLYTVGVGYFTSMAVGATVAGAIAVLAAVTLLPAVLVLLGTNVDRWSLKRPSRAAERARLWRWLGDLTIRRRGAVAFSTVLFLVVCSVPLLFVDTEVRTLSELSADDELRRDTDRFAAAFGAGALGPVDIVTKGDPRQVVEAIRSTPGVVGAAPPARGRDGWTRVAALLRGDFDSERSEQTVRRLREEIDARARATTLVGGPTAQAIDLKRRMDQRAPAVVAVTLLVAALMLVWGFRSLVIPLKAILTTLLSAGATLGILTAAYQWLGTDAGLSYFVPLFVFTIVFGLSIDYEVFLLSRIREEFLRTGDNDGAIRTGLLRSGRPITLAGLVMITVFVAFAMSSLASFEQLGVGMALAVLIDITLVRSLLVPATLSLLGSRNWWLPRFMGRRSRARAGA